MTSASDQSATPVPPADRSAREAVIRDLYALVAFYVANPEHPLPWYIQVHHVAPLAEVERIAEERHATVYGPERPMTDHRLERTSVPIVLLVATPREESAL